MAWRMRATCIRLNLHQWTGDEQQQPPIPTLQPCRARKPCGCRLCSSICKYLLCSVFQSFAWEFHQQVQILAKQFVSHAWMKTYSAQSFLMNGQLFAEYERVHVLGIPLCSKNQWLRIVVCGVDGETCGGVSRVVMWAGTKSGMQSWRSPTVGCVLRWFLSDVKT